MPSIDIGLNINFILPLALLISITLLFYLSTKSNRDIGIGNGIGTGNDNDSELKRSEGRKMTSNLTSNQDQDQGQSSQTHTQTQTPNSKPKKHQAIKPHALKVPGLVKLTGKRVVLASASPRRKEILATFGIEPEIIPSTFEETLPQTEFEDVHEYPVATATQKAVEVYRRLVTENPDDPPDLVIGADTVVLTHTLPATSNQDPSLLPPERPDILEKPLSKADNLRMLLDLNGSACEVVTGVTVVYPVLQAPGYQIKSMDERTLVHFSPNPPHILTAYADTGEGLDRAGGFAIQGQGAVLVSKIEGDFNNVVGFPGSAFLKFLEVLVEEEDGFLEV